MTRVAFVNHAAVWSGGEIALARLLAAVGDRVDATVVLAEDGPLVGRLREAGVAVEILEFDARTSQLDRAASSVPRPRAVWDTLRYIGRLRRRLRELDVDLVHTNSMKAHLYGGLAARLARVPQVWHARDRIAPDYLPRPALILMRTAAWVLPHAVVSNSSSTRATIPLRGNRVSVVMSDPIPAAPTQSARRSDARAFRFTVLGRLSPWKGQDVCLRAFAAAFADRDDVELAVVGGALFGEKDWELALKHLADDLGIDHQVRFTGHVDDVASVLARTDVLVHASTIPEPFGMVVVEGMAAGAAVIAADAGGPSEIIESGVNGMLVKPGDHRALAAAMRLLETDAGLRARLVAGGRQVAASFEPEHAARQLLTLYGTVLHRA